MCKLSRSSNSQQFFYFSKKKNLNKTKKKPLSQNNYFTFYKGKVHFRILIQCRILAHFWIPCRYQFFSFKVKNSFTETSTSCWLLNCHKHKKLTMDWNNNMKELDLNYRLGEATFLPVLWSQANISPFPLRWRTPSLKLPLPVDC